MYNVHLCIVLYIEGKTNQPSIQSAACTYFSDLGDIPGISFVVASLCGSAEK